VVGHVIAVILGSVAMLGHLATWRLDPKLHNDSSIAFLRAIPRDITIGLGASVPLFIGQAPNTSKVGIRR